MSEWYEDLSAEEIHAVHRRVAQAEGLLKSALNTMEGRGGEYRNHLADAYSKLVFSETAFKGAKELKEREEA